VSDRRLVLVRHAKAAQGAVDAERPLTSRGERDASAIGAALLRHDVIPDRAVVSPARRARETWEQASADLPIGVPQIVDARIYDNTADALLAVVHDTPADVRTLALIGHNPSIERLADLLDDEAGAAAARARLAEGYPTSGIAVFTLHAPYADIRAGSATLTHFSAPRG
jgi:phosphohistidine phosphatase